VSGVLANQGYDNATNLLDAGGSCMYINTPLAIIPTNESNYEWFGDIFHKAIVVMKPYEDYDNYKYGVNVVATEGVTDDEIMRTAGVLAQYLDNNEDGIVDSGNVGFAMREYAATMVMFANQSECDAILNPVSHPYFLFTSVQDVQGSETWSQAKIASEKAKIASEGNGTALLEEMNVVSAHARFMVVDKNKKSKNSKKSRGGGMDLPFSLSPDLPACQDAVLEEVFHLYDCYGLHKSSDNNADFGEGVSSSYLVETCVTDLIGNCSYGSGLVENAAECNGVFDMLTTHVVGLV